MMGCGPSHPVDAGVDAAVDARDPRFPGPDTCSPTAPCGCLGTSLRCDCATPCPESSQCSPLAPICLGSDTADFIDTCGFRDESFTYCASGDPCLVRRGPRDEGVCIPVETCLELNAPDPPLMTLGTGECRWSTGESVDTAPPAVACPESTFPFLHCGGSCGSSFCPSIDNGIFQRDQMSCVGVNAERGSGICAYGEDYCLEDDPEANRWNLGGCGVIADAPCACLVMDHAPEPARELGFLVEMEACRAYAAAHPGSTKCVDADWSPL